MNTVYRCTAMVLCGISIATAGCLKYEPEESVATTPSNSSEQKPAERAAPAENTNAKDMESPDSFSGEKTSAENESNDDRKNDPDSTAEAIPEKVAEAKPSEPKPRMVSFNGGSHSLRIDQWPLLGSQDSQFVMVAMFDYACLHCRSTHRALKEAREGLGVDNVAIISLPVPLNSDCNPTVPRTNPRFAESCETAKLAVACWRVSPKKFQEFHDWMFEGETAPTYADAKQKADELVGQQTIDAELAKDTASNYIAKTVQLYKSTGAGPLPRVMFKSSAVVGEVSSAAELTEIIKTRGKQENYKTMADQ